MGASARNRGHRGERARNSHRYTTEPLMPPKAILSAEWDQPPSHPSLTCTHIHVHSAPSFFFSRASRRVFVAALVIRTFSDWRRACDTYARWVEKERRKEGERERETDTKLRWRSWCKHATPIKCIYARVRYWKQNPSAKGSKFCAYGYKYTHTHTVLRNALCILLGFFPFYKYAHPRIYSAFDRRWLIIYF